MSEIQGIIGLNLFWEPSDLTFVESEFKIPFLQFSSVTIQGSFVPYSMC